LPRFLTNFWSKSFMPGFRFESDERRRSPILSYAITDLKNSAWRSDAATPTEWRKSSGSSSLASAAGLPTPPETHQLQVVSFIWPGLPRILDTKFSQNNKNWEIIFHWAAMNEKGIQPNSSVVVNAAFVCRRNLDHAATFLQGFSTQREN
jgi:hypothetical protein